MGPVLTPERTTLVVMDVQERIVAAMPDEARSEAVDNIIRLVQGARILGLQLMVTEQYPTGLGRTIEPVAHALEEFAERPEVISKVEFDACQNTAFAAALEASLSGGKEPGDRSIVVCGTETHVCVYQTARALLSRGYDVHIPYDAACSRRQDNHRIAQSMLERIGATITCTETVLFELLSEAGTEEFKQISKLVR
ncbi:MAG: isochorismatase family protein [Myxococcales bacterium]|nr:isochorismatase family protein [Myxococcales bacterium]